MGLKKHLRAQDKHLGTIIDTIMVDICAKPFPFRFEVAWKILFKGYKPADHKHAKKLKKVRRHYFAPKS